MTAPVRLAGRIAAAGVALAAATGPRAPARAQAPIQDNSFLVEEAYNQERGVVQHISTLHRAGQGAWGYAFTQEWPLGGIRHQLGYTLPVVDAGAGAGAGLGDVGVNYRVQALGSPEAPLLLAPRLTLHIPTGSHADGRGVGGAGVQLNLPLTYVVAPTVVTHWNAGITLVPSAAAPGGGEASTTSVNLGIGTVWLVRRYVNLLLEGVWTSDGTAAADGTSVREESAWLSPGLRAAFDVGAMQVVPGLAYIIGIGPGRGESLLLYLSFEHPFSR